MGLFREYFEDRVKIFNEHHYNLLIEATENDIHKLRTTIKKLRTFNTLLDGLLFRQKDFPKGFTEVFKLTGEIRDIQVQQKVLNEYDCAYKSYLGYSCKDKVSQFKIKQDFKEEIDYLDSKLSIVENYHIDEQLISNIEFNIRMLYIEVANMIKNVSIENLHDIRKKVKRIFYIKLMVGDKVDVEILDEIQETIGIWHDSDITINNIRNFSIRGLDDKDIEILKILTTKKDFYYNRSLELIKSFNNENYKI